MPLNYSLYGFFIAIAFLVCFLVAEKISKKDNKSPELVWDIGFTTLICGLIGARAYHVADLWEYYSSNPALILHFWEGGLGIWGGLLGAFVGTYVYLKLQKIKDIKYWFDLFALVTPLGQAIGRIGNYINQENFGYPTNLPWGIYIDPEHRPTNYASFNKFHPLFFYEAILDLILFGILMRLRNNFKLGEGKIAAFYLIGYSVIRFFVEFLKVNAWSIDGINTAQSFSVVTILGCYLYLKSQHKKESTKSL